MNSDVFAFYSLKNLKSTIMFHFSADIVEVMHQFFMAIKNHDLEAAYQLCSTEFQDNTSLSELEEYLTRDLIDNFKQARCESRTIRKTDGSLACSILKESGESIPASFRFGLLDEGDWRITSVLLKDTTIGAGNLSALVPSDREQVMLVNQSIFIFAQCVKQRSMEAFYEHISSLFQRQASVHQLDEAFKPFYNLKTDFTVLQKYSPVFTTEPFLDEDDVLNLVGYYPTQPSHFYFTLKYLCEGRSWKLLSINVNI